MSGSSFLDICSRRVPNANSKSLSGGHLRRAFERVTVTGDGTACVYPARHSCLPLRNVPKCIFRFSEFFLTHPPNQVSYPPRSVPAGGAYASSRHAGRDAVAATASSDERRRPASCRAAAACRRCAVRGLSRTLKSCGPGIPMLMPSWW